MPLTSITRYPGGVSNLGPSDGLVDLKMPHPGFYADYDNDFFAYYATDWTLTGTGTAPALVAGDGGILQMASATAAEENMSGIKAIAPALNRDLYYAVIMNQTGTDATASGFVAGLTVAATAPIATPPTDGIYIRKALASTQVVAALRIGNADVATVNMGQWALNTWFEMGFIYTAANGVLNAFMGTPFAAATGGYQYPSMYRLATSPAALPAGPLGHNWGISPGASAAAQTFQLDHMMYGKGRGR